MECKKTCPDHVTVTSVKGLDGPVEVVTCAKHDRRVCGQGPKGKECKQLEPDPFASNCSKCEKELKS